MLHKQTWLLLKKTFRAYSEDNISTLGAALSYYAIFLLAPLLIILIAAAGFVFGAGASRGEVFASLQSYVGPQAAQMIQTLIVGVGQRGTGIIATIAGILTMLVGVSGLFGQLQSSLNQIWRVDAAAGSGVSNTLRRRALTFVLLFGVSALLLASLALSAVLATLGRFFNDKLPGGEAIWRLAHLGASFVVLSALFAMVFKILPDVKIRWRDVWIGSAFTSLFFSLGKMALGIYLGKSGFTSAYGAAGSILLLLAWIYYSSQIFFVGAEFTRAYAETYGPAKAGDPQAGAP